MDYKEFNWDKHIRENNKCNTNNGNDSYLDELFKDAFDSFTNAEITYTTTTATCSNINLDSLSAIDELIKSMKPKEVRVEMLRSTLFALKLLAYEVDSDKDYWYGMAFGLTIIANDNFDLKHGQMEVYYDDGTSRII